ncbi:phospholipase D family protein [Bradyrhizobium sp. SZCCHNRI3042]|uniref:phospholipase D family protein n=1 Tax=Bradyrhizobium sp. SZCCHNRI3042 TaxID=3057291 RepID=UPI00291695DB|nr:phospholipase D family protein [Bradyrhizobium sp. SZCCHNRI3042]
MPDILYSSAAIKKRIHELFDAPKSPDRRVALVAYIGQDYADYLPSPHGVEVVCNPTPGATSAAAVDSLLRNKASVRFSDKLHMKVYWSESRGCIITSANLSKNAFGVKGLKEAGVWLPPNTVDIDKLVKEAQPYAVTDTGIERLRIQGSRYERALARAGMRSESGFQYLDWYQLSSAARTAWKVGDYSGDDGVADAATARLPEFDVASFRNWHGFDVKSQLIEEDWLLQFECDYEREKVIGDPSWMFVDFVVPFGVPANLFQAIQVYPNRSYERPPFLLTAEFKAAFRSAVSKLKDRSTVKNSMKPSDLLLRAIADRLAS